MGSGARVTLTSYGIQAAAGILTARFIDNLHRFFSECEWGINRPDRCLASASTLNDQCSEIENSTENTLAYDKAFNLAVIQFHGIPSN